MTRDDEERDGDTVKIARSRSKHKNSHGGCLTCKQRRLKCDEEKPVCRRCRSTARECRPDPRRLKATRSVVDLAALTTLPIMEVFNSPTYASSCLHHFTSVTLPVFNRCEPSPLWEYLKRELPYSGSIRCMAIALGHEHRASTDPAALNVPQASMFYIQAVQSLRQAIAELEVEKPPNMLFTVVFHCLLLVILQCFRRSFDELNIHLQHGLRMASKALRDPDTTVTAPLKESFRLLKQYAIAVALFNPLLPQGAVCSGSRGVTNATANQALSDPDGLKATFDRSLSTTHDHSLHDHEQELLLDLIRITITNRKPRIMDETSSGDGNLYFAKPMQMDASLQMTVSSLRVRHASLERAILRQRTRMSDQGPSIAKSRFEVAEARCMLLGVYLRCRWSGYACNYDLEHDVFRRIVDKIQNSLGQPQASDDVHDKLSMASLGSSVSISLGAVAPLFYVVVMCRQPEIRRRALELLASCPRQEGPWSSRLVHNMCSAFIAYEEQKAREAGCGFDLTGYIPEHCRIAYYYYYHHSSSVHAVDETPGDYIRVFRRPSGTGDVYTHEDLNLNSISALDDVAV